jgi:GntR family transcriptional regulator, rspAB operon transcriptional repressor
MADNVRTVDWRSDAEEERRDSIASRVYRALRSDIIELKLVPRTRLSEKELSLQFGVSRSPIREALLRLAEEGLVWIRPQSGTAVAPISIAAVLDGQFVREALECAAIEKAIVNLKDDDIVKLRNILALQRHHARAKEEGAFFQADETLHATLMQIAGHGRIWRLVEPAKLQIDRLRRLAMHMPLKMDTLIDEHRTIVEAVIARDNVVAVAAMKQHLRMVFTTVRKLLDQHHDYFAEE